jgi:hypothetical protein
MPKVKLVSDFHDYYDYMFDLDGIIYERKSINTFVPRQIAFQRLSRMGLKVPKYGAVGDMIRESVEPEFYVVYEDQFLHRSEGKVLRRYSVCDINKYTEKEMSFLASEYILPEMNATSYRYLRIGCMVVWLKYKSNDNWRSNFGSEISIIQIPKREEINMQFVESEPYPLFAIDFVKAMRDGEYYAIDYNTSPGLKGTLIEDNVSATNIVQWIKQWFDVSVGNMTAGIYTMQE